MQQLRDEVGLLRAELRVLQQENKALRNDLLKTQEDLAGAQRGVESIKAIDELTNKTLMTELDYFPSARDPVDTLALECIKTQLRSNSIHLTGSSSPATFRMTSFSEYKESGKVWYTPLFYLPHGWLKPASFPAPNFHLALYTGCGKIGKGAGHTWQNS